MEKTNMYPEMPTNPGMPPIPDVPPSYNQTFPTAPAVNMAEGMTSSGQLQPQPTPYIPQQQSFGQQLPPQPQQIFIQNLPPIPPLGPRPCLVTCPSCHQRQVSNIVIESSMKTHLFALALCVVGCFCCSCLPYFIDNCKNVNHYCKNCNAYFGMYNNK
ncbi:lipopolysaccharide-induced tumor necrosis factor-alpha factor homolog isoform X2 [Episyrphus balteatus]|uniref:lipopolysaccharide-induced tumor necrosis factor-alpha factor homolog isoform X2 n=1 Tax=Episyrphus balteatus TaxID=286459 RepID=UPI002485035D|nr:lipopolysaccharide-induced tumor necrosis factor-alpha factor homolog isoform X2 [Episyrphus balteatus]XP_055838244.1 lipopolysaccharide-induced tumor necrosis factor-alpha factor homolog isoform X2 [Episyrphus balteatus]